MYCTDADDTSPTVEEYFAPYGVVDYWQLVQPYAKNTQMFVCPDDQFIGCDALEGLPSTAPHGGCISYGSNWGPMQSFAANSTEGGLYGAFYFDNNAFAYIAPGVSMSTVLASANMFAFGESADTPWYTLCMGSILSRYNLSGTTLSKQSQLRHAGHFQMSYVDGHAKQLQFVGGTWTGSGQWPAYGYTPVAPTALPASSDHYGDWCSDPTMTIQTDIGPMVCNQVAPLVLSQTTLWPN